MLKDFTGADKVYIACGYTDIRKGIDGLATLVQQQFEHDPFTNTLFLFCGRRKDELKGSIGMVMDFCFCINVWKNPNSGGQKHLRRYCR